MKTSLLMASCLYIISQAKADEQLGRIYNFAEDIRDIMLKGDGNPTPNLEFILSTQQADQMQALSSLDNSTREFVEAAKGQVDCNQNNATTPMSTKEFIALDKRIKDRQFQIEAVVFSSNKKYEQNALGRFMNDDYTRLMGQLYVNGNINTAYIYSVPELTERYKLSHPTVHFDSLNLTQQEKLLRDFAESFLGEKLPPGLLMKEMAFQSMVANSSNWRKILTEAKNQLSSEQKIQLVSKLGGYFGNLYNNVRSNAGDSVRGTFVTASQLLDSVKAGTPGGICRDIALAQTQFLEALGFKKNYVIAYKTFTDRHATVISTDPVTGKIIKFNYSETTSIAKGSGTEALTQDTSMPDFGTNYRIYDSSGKPVTMVRNELSQMLKNTSGGESSRDFDQKNYSINSVAFKNPYVDGNLFTGTTSTGLTLYGVSLHKDLQVSDYITTSVGASVSKLSGDKSLVKIDQDSLYLRASVEINSPSINIGPVQTNAFAVVDTQALISNNKESSLASNYTVTAKNQVDADLIVSTGIENKYQSSDKKTSIDNKVYADFYPDWNHVASGEKTIMVMDKIVVQTGVSANVSDNTKALVDTAVLIRNYGTNIIIKGILEDEKRKMRYTAGVAAPVTKDMPTFLPGGEKRIMASVEKESGNFTFSIEVQKNLDNKSTSIGAKAKGSF